jgi:hypothetical protein
MLERAAIDALIKNPPHEILHFEPTAEAAVRWIESQSVIARKPLVRPKRRPAAMRQYSFYSPPIFESFSSWLRKSMSRDSIPELEENGENVVASVRKGKWFQLAITFTAGLVIGAVVASRSKAFRS